MSLQTQNICILGATGSIGVNTLSVIDSNSDQYKVVALTANTNRQKLYQQCLKYRPAYAVMNDHQQAALLEKDLKKELGGHSIEVLSGQQGLEFVASLSSVDAVMCAIVGAAGLLPTLAAAKAGKKVLLANKEALVMSGALFMEEIRNNNASLIPIDSEHNAIFQCLPATHSDSLIRGTCSLSELGIEKILLTGSGGPFRTTAVEKLSEMTPQQACAHPNWTMGRKISVDSATMMNKGLEYIEARWLFSAAPEEIEIIIHPQSVVHSMVHYKDGSVLAQLGLPDMRTPIAHGLAYPDRISSEVKGVDFTELAQLTFEASDEQRFPSLRLAREALEAGGCAATVLNAANEVAVDSFLNEQIKFTDIVSIIEDTMAKMDITPADSITSIIDVDGWARRQAEQFVKRHQ
ncbi:MAG: 1-deoxy-D-xylulose-5-phosphate reductoisomerase [Gammaproteobacteria bacterium]|nr:MAG: 1-deoxy-D-xylulose-5-phosphate reductoisomerase [Gammaproteobacteria bacterium]